MQAHSVIFSFGDFVLLLLVSTAAMVAMDRAHALIPNLALAWFAGMAAAMLIQTLLALLVAPLLGSIESMVPSMSARGAASVCASAELMPAPSVAE